MSKESVFTWAFEPENFFRLGEEQREDTLGDYRLVIRDGAVDAIVPDLRAIAGWPNLHDIKRELRRDIEKYLDGQAIWAHQTYQLSYEPCAIPAALDDALDRVLRVSATQGVKFIGYVASQVVGPDGTVACRVSSERRSREFARLTRAYYDHDNIIDFIIRRYLTAIEDPDNEFTHLFDILEALKDRFDEGGREIRRRLDVDKDKFNAFCTLANNPNEKPVRQGRHKGRNIEELREATDGELRIARQVARELVFGYLRFLDQQES